MRAFKPALSGKGLLAASVAMLSANVIAETAGRVSFVSGTVTASLPNGTTRQLQRGDTINGGDKISTQTGRIQIRFTDGGFVSLQPNTVFGVDEYLYSTRKPEESSLFFSLLQGGMRTITGAIGKVNKQSYKVRTPVATIGIRGTGYRAKLTERGLIVSVGSGFVNVANTRGDTTAGAGQNILVPSPDSSPSLGDEQADLQAAGVNGDEEQVTEDSSQDSSQEQTIAVGNVQNERGDYIFLFTTAGKDSLPSSNLQTGTPRYYAASTVYGPSTASNGGNGLLATFDEDGSITGSKGALLKLFTSPQSPQSTDPLPPAFDLGTLHVINTSTMGNLSWGEFTDGTSAANIIFGSGPLTLSSTDFKPYIIGAPALTNLAKGTATYNYQGGTTPRSSTGKTGSLDSMRITVNLDFATLDLAMQVTMPMSTGTDSTVYSVTTRNAAPISIANLSTSNQFTLDSSMLEVSANTSSGACGSFGGSCYAQIDGFFAGDGAAQIGAAYEISSSLETIKGVAGLGLSAYNGNTVLADGPGYTAAYANSGSNSNSPGTSGLAGDFSDADVQSSLTLDFSSTDGGLEYATNGYNQGIHFERTTATVINDSNGSSGSLKWGRWSSGVGDTVTTPDGNIVLNTHQYMHYIVGPMTQPNIFLAFQPNSTATYTYTGGSGATGTDGSTGTLIGTIAAIFGPIPKVSLNLGLNMSNGAKYSITSSPLDVALVVGYSGLSATGKATFAASTGNGLNISAAGSGTGACFSGSGCNGSISGFFAGQQAQQIGLSYNINDQGSSKTSSISGTAGFTRGAIVAPTNPPAGG